MRQSRCQDPLDVPEEVEASAEPVVEVPQRLPEVPTLCQTPRHPAHRQSWHTLLPRHTRASCDARSM